MPRRPPRRKWTSIEVVEGFIRRARRIMGHSLLTEQRPLIDDLVNGKHDVTIVVNPRTGEQSATLRQEFPPEEAIESLTARIRPVIENGEPIHYNKVLNALEELVPVDVWNDFFEPVGGHVIPQVERLVRHVIPHPAVT